MRAPGTAELSGQPIAAALCKKCRRGREVPLVESAAPNGGSQPGPLATRRSGRAEEADNLRARPVLGSGLR